eukprot:4702562-Pleurochrysis_carterae.AAC.4
MRCPRMCMRVRQAGCTVGVAPVRTQSQACGCGPVSASYYHICGDRVITYTAHPLTRACIYATPGMPPLINVPAIASQQTQLTQQREKAAKTWLFFFRADASP